MREVYRLVFSSDHPTGRVMDHIEYVHWLRKQTAEEKMLHYAAEVDDQMVKPLKQVMGQEEEQLKKLG